MTTRPVLSPPGSTTMQLIATASAAPPPPHTMQCLEVWGGNGATDNGVTMPGIDAWVLSRPHKGDEAGGDVHYVSSCGTGRISRILVADVAGHGSNVAELGRTLRSLMRRYMNYIDQTRLVEQMNAEFTAASTMGRFATAVVASFFAPTNTFTVVNAGHPRPLAFSSKKGTWQILEVAKPAAADERGKAPSFASGNLPLGIDDVARYEQFALRLRQGDLVVIYTDSLVEARRPDGTMLGEEGLLVIARAIDQTQPDQFAPRLYQAVIDASGGELPDDDVTVLVIRPNGLQPKMSFAESLRAQFTFLGMLARGVLPGALPVPWPEARIETLLGPLVKGVQKSWGKDAREL
ncbi:MAG: PP2C family protein-serine/threonine phosphatase [Phycisphaerales bacterium]